MFERLKEKLHIGRHEDFDELKEHVTSPKFEPISHDFRERFEPSGGFAPRPEARHEPLREPIYEPRRELEPIDIPRREEAMPTFESFEDVPRPPSLPERRERSLERIEIEIRFIKEQLSAIKAIVETINEKVKNIQRVVEGRY